MAKTASRPLAAHCHTAGGLDQTIEFLKRTRAELRQLRTVLAWKDRIQIIDVNHDAHEINGLGYSDPEVIPILKGLSASYDPQTVHQPPHSEPKQFRLGRAHPWAEDRAM